MTPSPSEPHRHTRRLACAAGMLWGVPGWLHAQSASEPQTFSHGSWQALLRELPRPAVVMFTATWCPNCPAILEELAQLARSMRKAPMLAVVVIDGAGKPGLGREPHYRVADRLLVFQGSEAALRFEVNPRWRGVTPHVALLAAGSGAPVFVDGMPTPAQWRVLDA